MHDPELINYTPFWSELLPLIDKNGAECRTAIVKATIQPDLNGVLIAAETQRPLRYGDEMWGPPEVPDIRYPADLCAFKPGTDFVVVGHAQGPEHRKLEQLQIDIIAAGRRRTLRVYGERIWRGDITGVSLSSATPIGRVPLAWSLAFGGLDASDPDHPFEEPLNPVGRGIARRPKDLIGRPGPQIEDASHPISRPQDRPRPAGCAPIGRSFEPRRSSAGTYDSKWLNERHPGRPLDYRDQHENCAPPPFVFEHRLAGGESFEIGGFSPEGPLRFVLPRLRVVIEAEMDGSRIEQRPDLDTILVDIDMRLIELTWRWSFVSPPKMRNRFTAVRTRHKEGR